MARGTPKEPSELPKRLKLFGTLFLGLILIGTGLTSIIKQYNFNEALVYTLETLAFMFHDETGIAKFLEIFLAIFGVFLIWWILWSLFDTIFEKNFKEYITEIITTKKVKHMKNHYIIAGGGRVGDEVAHKLSEQKKQYVIVEKDKDKISQLRKEGLKTIEGDITEHKTLIKAGIKNADTLIITSPETETNILVTLLAKELNTTITIYARSDTPEYESLLQKAGVKQAIVPELSAAKDILEHIRQEEKNKNK